MREIKRLGLIGAGAIAQTYVAALADAPFARLVAVADPRREAAEAVAETADARAFADASALLDAAPLDGVVICTPPATHGEIVRAALERRIPVLCEKPLCLEATEARALRAVASRAGTVFTMASKFRYVEDLVRARAMIASGLLGEVMLLENVFTSRVDMTRRWNALPRISGGGVVIDNGTHSVDIVRYLLGPIDAVLAVAGPRGQALAVEDSAMLHLRTRSGADARVELSWSYQKETESFVSVQGTAGVLAVGWRQSRYRRLADRDWTTFGSGYEKGAAFRAVLANFCAAIDGGAALLIDADDAVASVEVIDAAYRSIAAGGWAPVDGTGPRAVGSGPA